MTNNYIITCIRELSSITGCTGVLGWYVYKNLKLLREAIEPYDRIHNDLVLKHGGSRNAEVPKENRAAFEAEITPLLLLDQDVLLLKMDRKQFDIEIKNAKEMSAEAMMIFDNFLVAGEAEVDNGNSAQAW